MPPTNGPAWFTREVAVMDDPREMIRVLRMRGVDVRAALARIAWVLRDEAPRAFRTDAACASARVVNVRTDRLGQTAEIEVATEGTCLLVVATNYVSLLRATDTVRELEVFPVDVALTGVVVPSGATLIELGPVVHRQWWWALLGYLALAGSLTLAAFSLHCRDQGSASSSSG
jgi:hypothetical protein